MIAEPLRPPTRLTARHLPLFLQLSPDEVNTVKNRLGFTLGVTGEGLFDLCRELGVDHARLLMMLVNHPEIADKLTLKKETI